jgi:hypothetical protein
LGRKDKPGDRASAKRKRLPSQRRAKSAPGRPNPESVIAEKSLVSPKGNVYRILTTTETDPYDPPVSSKKRRG